MSREKQIEEMANDLAQHCPDLVENCCGASSCVSCLTRYLYNAGYRKQKEGEWLDTGDEQLDKIYSGYKCSVCGFIICGHSGKYCSECGAKMKGGE